MFDLGEIGLYNFFQSITLHKNTFFPDVNKARFIDRTPITNPVPATVITAGYHWAYISILPPVKMNWFIECSHISGAQTQRLTKIGMPHFTGDVDLGRRRGRMGMCMKGRIVHMSSISECRV